MLRHEKGDRRGQEGGLWYEELSLSQSRSTYILPAKQDLFSGVLSINCCRGCTCNILRGNLTFKDYVYILLFILGK